MFRGILSIAASILVLAGCGGPSDVSGSAGGSTPVPATSTAVSSAASILVTVHRTGGLAGVEDVVQVDDSGAWKAGTRSGKQTSGQLTRDRLNALQALVAAPDWQGETTASATRPCPDGFVYEVTAGDRTASSDDCRLDSRPTLAKLARSVLAEARL